MGSGATKEKTNNLNQIEQNQTSFTQIVQSDGSPQIFTLKNNSQLGKAFSLLKKQQFLEAIGILESLIEKNSNLADAQYLKGLAYLGLNDLQKALFYCQAALDIDKQHAHALAEIGNIYTLERKQGKIIFCLLLYEEALIIFNQLIELNEKSFEGNFGIGFINLLLNNFDVADPYFQNALNIKSKDKAALLNYGHLLIKQQKFDQGLQYYEQALKEDPKYSEAINAITNLYLHQKKYSNFMMNFVFIQFKELKICSFMCMNNFFNFWIMQRNRKHQKLSQLFQIVKVRLTMDQNNMINQQNSVKKYYNMIRIIMILFMEWVCVYIIKINYIKQ